MFLLRSTGSLDSYFFLFVILRRCAVGVESGETPAQIIVDNFSFKHWGSFCSSALGDFDALILFHF